MVQSFHGHTPADFYMGKILANSGQVTKHLIIQGAVVATPCQDGHCRHPTGAGCRSHASRTMRIGLLDSCTSVDHGNALSSRVNLYAAFSKGSRSKEPSHWGTSRCAWMTNGRAEVALIYLWISAGGGATVRKYRSCNASIGPCSVPPDLPDTVHF